MGYDYDADKNILQNNIKKALYREKPIAHCIYHGHHAYQYYCYLKTLFDEPYKVNFTIPTQEMGDTLFINEMQAQLLIHWIEL